MDNRTNQPEDPKLTSLDLHSASSVFAALADPAPELQQIENNGPTLPGYIIGPLIDKGGHGIVHRAYRIGSDRPLALKILQSTTGQKPEIRRAFRELELLENLRLPALPALIDHGEHQGKLYLITELIEGQRLDHYCRDKNPSRRDRVKLLAQIASAVQSLHEHGVIHRDLKPANILIDQNNQPVLIDLGIASLINPDVRETLTLEGTPIGTPAFMAPEQARGDLKKISTRTDVYGLGATAYQTLTGSTPHPMEADLPETIRRVGQDHPRNPRTLDPSLPKPLAAILTKSTDPKPELRYSSAAELASDLNRWLHGEPVEAGGLTLPQRLGRTIARHPLLTTLTICLTLVIITGVATWGSVWWINNRPYEIKLDPNDFPSEVTLLARSGRVLQTWKTEGKCFIPFADFIEADQNHLKKRLILIAADQLQNQSTPDEFRFYDPANPTRLLHSFGGRVDLPAQMPPPISHVEPAPFSLAKVELTEVFPASPGPELIAIYSSTFWSPNVLRILSLDGKILFELWHDGGITDFHWLPEKNLLIAAGFNSETNWPGRNVQGTKILPRPIVIFAIRPQYNAIHRKWIHTPGGKGTLQPLWYRALMPPVQVDRLVKEMGEIDAITVTKTESPVQFRFQLRSRYPHPLALSLDIDALTGQPLNIIPSDTYQLRVADQRLPDPEIFHFAPLPEMQRYSNGKPVKP